MSDDAAARKKRQRHFWKWVTDTKNVSKSEVSKDRKTLNTLRAEHSKNFPDLYGTKKSFSHESVKEFHRKILKFNITIRESDDFTYCDEMFDGLPLFDGEIEDSVSGNFLKHYLAGYKSFTKNGGVSNHRTYQMHYLDMLFKNFKRIERKNKYAIRKDKEEALLWKKEPKTLCCNSGQVPPINPSVIEDGDILQLYEGRLENDADKAMCYKIQGRICHKIGYLRPERLQASFGLFKNERGVLWKKKTDCFLDLYFYHDVDQQIKFRASKITNASNLSKRDRTDNPATKSRRKREFKAFQDNEAIVRLFFNYFTTNNKCLSKILKEVETAKDLIRLHVEKNGKVPEVSITLKSAEGIQTREHKGVYHLPTSSSSVGAIVNLDTSNRHLQITIESPKPDTKYNTKIVTHENVFYDAFQYPLLIPNGNQFVVDNYVKVESMRLAFIENNQSDIRKERSDILQGENGKHKVQRIIIPPTYVGGPRYMNQRQQDALAFVSNYGSPDFFMTFTMNPAWTQLEESSTQSKSTSKNKGDRPDLVSRIFKMKIDSLIDDLTVRCVFGKVKARRAIGEGGNSFEKKVKGNIVNVDNSWVVPYNPYLCLKYNAHINVECSNSIKAIAYVTKYVNKGCDRILYSKTKEDDEVINEVRNYQDARYVNANEATWKIFKFPIHKSFPPVTTLDLHLEGENEIFFKENENAASLQRKTAKDTQLTAFFKLCKENEFAATLYYHEIPNHFIYDKANSKWLERKTRTHVKGPSSYEDLRTVDGVTHDTYREAVKAMGLLNDEETWLKTIMEIISHTNNRDQLRTTYASMLVFSDLEDQRNIWEETKDLFASDYLFRRGLTEYNDEIYRDALDDI
ncbi:uncharacterized protein LOC143022924 [Oratosquilla oratoria]|uniref:uncharacterized protein LOC143022924 n=1 Tax=Oratosquilla oratoria TaxID=337810 RepID=UPI003F775A51